MNFRSQTSEINSAIADLLLRSHGLDISKFDPSFFDKSLKKRITDTQCVTTEAYFTLLEQNNNESGILCDSLRISYSEFFRDPLTFAVLERILLPSIVMKKGKSGRKEIRIWSAACAAGQETYSLAILLKELKNYSNEEINFRIFATDQCQSNVEQARKGEFSAAALNNLNLRRFNHWFNKVGDSFIVKPELKENIYFSVFDLFSEQFSSPPSSIYGEFDLVICANLLFYYYPEYQKKILVKMRKCISNEGYLVTGGTERDILIKNNYIEVFPQSAIFYR